MWAIRSLTGVIVTLVWIVGGMPHVGCAAAGPASEVATPADMHADAASHPAGPAAADHAAAGANGHGSDLTSTNPISVDPDLAIVTAIVFLLLLAVLGKFAWRPIIEAIDRREKSVADNLAEVQRNTDEARRLLAEHESKLMGAAAEVRQLLDQARQDAEWQKQQIFQEAQAAAQQEKQRAARNQRRQDGRAAGLGPHQRQYGRRLGGQDRGAQLSPDDHARLIGETLQQLPSEN